MQSLFTSAILAGSQNGHGLIAGGFPAVDK
jgi:hypothetical protein